MALNTLGAEMNPSLTKILNFTSEDTIMFWNSLGF